MSVTVQRGRGFEQTVPHDTPESLNDLQGPTSGTIRVRPRIDTSPDPVYDLGDTGQRWSLYSAVVRAGLPNEQATILNREILVELWVELNLPARCRAIWEAKFPELTEARQSRAS